MFREPPFWPRAPDITLLFQLDTVWWITEFWHVSALESMGVTDEFLGASLFLPRTREYWLDRCYKLGEERRE